MARTGARTRGGRARFGGGPATTAAAAFRGRAHPADVLHVPARLAPTPSAPTALGVLGRVERQHHLATVGCHLRRVELPHRCLQYLRAHRRGGELRHAEEVAEPHRHRLDTLRHALPEQRVPHAQQPRRACDDDPKHELLPQPQRSPVRLPRRTPARLPAGLPQDTMEQRSQPAALAQRHELLHSECLQHPVAASLVAPACSRLVPGYRPAARGTTFTPGAPGVLLELEPGFARR